MIASWIAVHRRGAMMSVLLAAGAAVAIASIQVTSAAFTDQSLSRLGTDGAIGGSYDIALLTPDGTVVEGDPTPLILDTSASGAITFTSSSTASVETRVVTTTAATGPVRLSLYNAYPGTRPPDPGNAGPGADPYDFVLFTVSVDGIPVAAAQTASAVNASGIVITGWTQSVAKTISVATTLPRAVGNPYVFDRAMVLGLRFDGATS